MLVRREPGKQGKAAPGRFMLPPGLRRWSATLAALAVVVVLCALGVAILSSLSLKPDAARGAVEARLEEMTGLPVSFEGEASFTLLPQANLALSRIRIGAPDDSRSMALSVDRLIARFSPWQALIGRAKITKLTFVRPELTSGPGADPAGDKPSTPKAELAMLGGLHGRSMIDSFLSRFNGLKSIEIRDGVLSLSPHQGALRISSANLEVSWPARAEPVRVSGSYVWNGQPTEVNLRVEAPTDFLSGVKSPIDFDLSAPSLQASLEGEGSMRESLYLDGRLQLRTPSLSRALEWFGSSGANVPDIGAIALNADLSAIGHKLNFNDAALTVGGYTGQGALDMVVDEGGRPLIGGTLAFTRLDVNGFAEAIAPFPNDPFDLARPFSVDFAKRLDLDLRVSAANAGIGGVPVNDLAATVKVKDGIAMLDVGDAALLSGHGQARLAVDFSKSEPVARGTATLTGIDTASFLHAIGVSSLGISGQSDITGQMTAPASNWADVVKHNAFDFHFEAANGSLSGFDPAVFLETGSKPFAFGTHDSAIPFRHLDATLTTRGPLVSLDTVHLSGRSGDFTAAGVLSTATNEVDVAGSFLPKRPEGEAAAVGGVAAANPVAFKMDGRWPSPIVTTGAESRPN